MEKKIRKNAQNADIVPLMEYQSWNKRRTIDKQ